MRNRTRLLLSALIAALTLSAAVTTAHARRIELSNTSIRTVWTETSPLELVGAFGLVTIRCQVTIEGTFHSRILSKVSGQLIGYITSAAVKRPCTNGEAWVQNGTEEVPGEGRVSSLPWHILFISFTGTLPRIRTIRLSLRGVGFLVRSAGTACLFLTTTANPAMGEIEVNETTGEITSLRPDETVSIPPLIELEGFCSSGRFRGRGAVSLTGGTTTRIIVRLVQ
jgi:hypothetical protein